MEPKCNINIFIINELTSEACIYWFILYLSSVYWEVTRYVGSLD